MFPKTHLGVSSALVTMGDLGPKGKGKLGVPHVMGTKCYKERRYGDTTQA